MIRFTTIKALLWFFATLLVALSFPLQVYTNSPYPSLLPYVVVVPIILLSPAFSKKDGSQEKKPRQSRNIGYMLAIYVAFLVTVLAGQTVLNQITPYEVLSALVIYLLPVAFFEYFRRPGRDREIRGVLLAMVLAALIVGVFFGYDSYSKLATGQPTEYARRAFAYSTERSNQSEEEANRSRIEPRYRASGLLQHHSVSGAWIVFGAFASLALVPSNRRIIRRVIVLLFGTMLLLGLNFASIVIFAITMFLFEFGGTSLLRSRFSAVIGNLVSFVVLVGIVSAVAFWVAGDEMSAFMSRLLVGQKNFALGLGADDPSKASQIVAGLEAYLEHVLDFPPTLLVGDGFGSSSSQKGGDVGFVYSMTTFGLPFFLAIAFGLLRLIKFGIRQLRRTPVGLPTEEAGLDQGAILQFSICVMLLVLLDELHYSVWAAKAILPIMFFALALYGRFIPAARQR